MHTIKPRNPLACAAILKKGGAHAQSRSGQRRAQKQALWAELEQDWDLDLERDRLPGHPAAAAAQDAGEAFLARQAPKETGHHPMACFFWAHAARQFGTVRLHNGTCRAGKMTDCLIDGISP